MSAQANRVVPLDAQVATVRPALVGGDERARVAAADLIDALGGREAWAQAVGAVRGGASR
ncbi:Sugar kinase OS=Streptomyces fumanus OX=67302 GN=GCM10018772_02500 PE=3 SV=1 [Streptomyces fumanus]